MKHVRRVAQSNAIAYLSLFIALGGTSMAAITLPTGSVGTRQLRNGAVSPIKLSGEFGGYVRAWASVSASGHVYASHGFKARISTQSNPPGTFVLFPTSTQVRGCAAMATVSPAPVTGEPSGPGFADASVVIPPQRSFPVGVGVSTYSTGDQPEALPFVVEVLC